MWPKIESVLDRYAGWIAIVLVLIASARIVATYDPLSHTIDEPAHIACGMEWLEKHTYTFEAQHPPLTRVMSALVPWISGSRGHGEKGMYEDGIAILFANGGEEKILSRARLGILPFFWIACWVTFACTRWIAGAASAVVSVFLLSMTPGMLAHAGLATTDMGLTAMLWLALYTGWRWIETPTTLGTCAFGAATGAAILAKFSTFAFLPAIALFGLLFWFFWQRESFPSTVARVRARLPQFGIAVGVSLFVVWAGYLFSFGSAPYFPFSVPAPELFRGIEEVSKHDKLGHLTYLMGSVNTVGWPSFFVIALGVKTPLAVLALGLAGFGLMLVRKFFGPRGWIVPSTILGILVFSSFFSQIKIGTRHVLPVLVGLAIAGGGASIWLCRRVNGARTAQAAVAILLVTVGVNSIAAHPDYIAYFNAIAGSQPQEFLIDSDLDWGQDTKRLARRLKEVGATEVYYNQFGAGDPRKMYGFPPIKPLDVNGPKPGWNAVNITPMKLGLWQGARYAYDPGFHFWPEQTAPVERVGRGILLIEGR